jgi:hypothetical protein
VSVVSSQTEFELQTYRPVDDGDDDDDDVVADDRQAVQRGYTMHLSMQTTPTTYNHTHNTYIHTYIPDGIVVAVVDETPL